MWKLILILSMLIAAAGVASTRPPAQSSTPGAAAPDKRPAPGAARPSRAAILKAQEILVQAGTLKSKPSGHMNPATRAAIRAYQKRNALKVTGTLTAETLQQMGVPADSSAHK